MALVVKSAVKGVIKKNNMRVSSNFWKAMDETVDRKILAAVMRAKENGRKTLRACDL